MKRNRPPECSPKLAMTTINVDAELDADDANHATSIADGFARYGKSTSSPETEADAACRQVGQAGPTASPSRRVIKGYQVFEMTDLTRGTATRRRSQACHRQVVLALADRSVWISATYHNRQSSCQ